MDVFKQAYSTDIQSEELFALLNEEAMLHGKTVGDLLDDSEDAGRLSKLMGRPQREVEEFIQTLEDGTAVPEDALGDLECDMTISTGLPSLDLQLGGGIHVGEVTEIFGASGCGKSHIISQLASYCTSIPGRECLYICTESFLETKRLKKMADSISAPLDDISYIYCPDLESQDHILFTQLPIKLNQLSNPRLIIIDSIAQHLRREGAMVTSTYLESKIEQQESKLEDAEDYTVIKEYHDQMRRRLSRSRTYANRSNKSYYLLLLYRHLSRLSIQHKCAIVAVNQVSDYTNVAGDPELYEEPDDPLNLEFQNAVIAGWKPKNLYEYFDASNFRVLVNTNDEKMIQFELDIINANKNEFISGGQSSENELSLLDKLNNINDGGCVRRVPALGYSWGKRVQNRILLLKNYKPAHLAENAGDDSGIEDGVHISAVKEWKIERYAKIVSASLIDTNFPRIPFEITPNGVVELPCD